MKAGSTSPATVKVMLAPEAMVSRLQRIGSAGSPGVPSVQPPIKVVRGPSTRGAGVYGDEVRGLDDLQIGHVGDVVLDGGEVVADVRIHIVAGSGGDVVDA